VLIVHGQSAKVEQFADRLIGLKGVQHGRLVRTFWPTRWNTPTKTGTSTNTDLHPSSALQLNGISR
jgi:hypothetical protein